MAKALTQMIDREAMLLPVYLVVNHLINTGRSDEEIADKLNKPEHLIAVMRVQLQEVAQGHTYERVNHRKPKETVQ